jgi:hypothetical protein
MRVARVVHWRSAVGVAVMVGLAATGSAAASTAPAGATTTGPASGTPAVKLTIYPHYATAGLPTTFEVKVTNTSSQGTALRSLQLSPPRGFTLGHTPLLRRTITIGTRSVAVRGITLKPGATIGLAVTATPPAGKCRNAVLRWTPHAFAGAISSSTPLALQSARSNLGVKVVCPNTAACGDGGPPCSTALRTNVSSYNVVDNATSGTLNQTLDVGRPLICRGYRNRDANWYDSLLTGLAPSPPGAVPFVDNVTYKIVGATSKGIGFCLGATFDFTTASGAQAPAGTLPNGKPGFIGLLPLCRNSAPPCIANVAESNDPSVKSGKDTTLTVTIPEKGDPWGGS